MSDAYPYNKPGSWHPFGWSMRGLLASGAAILLSLPSFGGAQQTAATQDIVSAANMFLASLSTDQRKKVVYGFNDAVQRARWSNLPTGFVPRGGISLREMSATQRDAALKLLATVLSPMGLEKVNEIREADDDFKNNGSKRGPRGAGPLGPPGGAQSGPPPQVGGPGGRPAPGSPSDPRGPRSGDAMFGSDLYYISFLGIPSIRDPWMLQFGGHHLAINITVDGSQGILTPTLTGAQPATFTVDGKIIRPLGRESDKALALLQSLNETQRSHAILGYTVADLVLGPGQDDKKIAPEGLNASAMNSSQQAMLLDLIAEWAGIMNERSAAARMTEIKTELSETWFAWSGPTSGNAGNNITAYYRIQGPHLVIEYAPQKDEPANHVHSIYRDPENDYGRALRKQ